MPLALTSLTLLFLLAAGCDATGECGGEIELGGTANLSELGSGEGAVLTARNKHDCTTLDFAASELVENYSGPYWSLSFHLQPPLGVGTIYKAGQQLKYKGRMDYSESPWEIVDGQIRVVETKWAKTCTCDCAIELVFESVTLRSVSSTSRPPSSISGRARFTYSGHGSCKPPDQR